MDGIDGVDNIVGDDTVGEPITLDELNAQSPATDHNAADPAERPDVSQLDDPERDRRQAARDDSEFGRELIKDNPGIDQGDSSEPDDRVPATGEAADDEDEEQARRREAREDSEFQREAHLEEAAKPSPYKFPEDEQPEFD